MKGYCDVCGIEIEIEMCCNGRECGCMGLPINPPVCSEQCYNTFMSKDYQDDKKAKSKSIFFNPK